VSVWGGLYLHFALMNNVLLLDVQRILWIF